MASMDVPADRPAAAPAARVAVAKPTYITWLTLAFMTTASVASLRSAPTMAVYGLTCVFLYIVPAIIFLLPQALVAAELASGWTGGVFRWVSEGLSPHWGLLAVWCQFAMTIFYYPTLLGFVASTLAYVFNPDLATNGVYTGIVIVVVFWARRVPVGARRHRRDRQARLQRPADRDADPGRAARDPRRRLPAAGQPVRGADGRRPPDPPVDRDREPRADRQQLPVLLGHGDERRARLVAAATRAEFPKAMFFAMRPRAADLHPAGAGDQLGRSRRSS